MKTGDDKEDQFHEGKTKISIVTYGVLWKWLTCSELSSPKGPLQRYKGFLLDEFASGHAKMDEIATCLRKCITRGGDFLSYERLIATSAALSTDHVEMCFGNVVKVVEVLERPYSLYRFVAAPMDKEKLLVVCCRLLVRALEKSDGNIIVFLPGWREITSLRSMLEREVALLDSIHLPHYSTVIRHSDTIGDDESEQDTKEDFEGIIVFLSTEICARSVTFANLGYVFVHPWCKTSVLHSSGCSELVYEKISADLERNEEGRGGRTRPTCVTYLYNVDDSDHALRSVEDCVSVEGSNRERSSSVADQRTLSMITACPSRMYYVEHTRRLLVGRGFVNPLWVRTPEPHELRSLDSEDKPNRRCMMYWYGVTLPVCIALSKKHPELEGFFLFEDTCILSPGVTYEAVYDEVVQHKAAIFAYGGFQPSRPGPRWHGSKGIYVTAQWCKKMLVILESMHLKDFMHVDLWLAHRVRTKLDQDFQTLNPLGGYGHRCSMTQNSTNSKWGGAWVPPPPSRPPPATLGSSNG